MKLSIKSRKKKKNPRLSILCRYITHETDSERGRRSIRKLCWNVYFFFYKTKVYYTRLLLFRDVHKM